MTELPPLFHSLITRAHAECRELDRYIYQHIPLTHAMQVHAAEFDSQGLTLEAPLAANHNHQASAFGGSLSSLAMLAGWGLMWLALDHARGTTIVVRDVHMEFLRPVKDTLRATCRLPAPRTWEKFRKTLSRRHKARLNLEIEIISDTKICARCAGSFVAYHEASGNV